MPTVKRMVCLANSRKLNGRCIAGRELANDKLSSWLRPVSDREHEEVSEYERQYEDGSDPQVRDIIDVPLLTRRPKEYQQENWRLDPKRYWVKVGRAKWKDLVRLEEPDGPLWINGYNTFHGKNDEIPLSQATVLRTSLRLIHVDGLRFVVFAPSRVFGNSKRRVQAKFHYDGVGYALWVTDPQYEVPYLARADGEYEIGECLLTVSLGEPYKGNCYKLVAAIIERASGGR